MDVLPLVANVDHVFATGWCTYDYTIEGAPDIEILCGGLNEKLPEAAGLWRQGHLLHFGFDLSPAEMNETGRSLLVNAIAYIARFTQDRPILWIPATTERTVLPRDRVARILANSENPVERFENCLTAETRALAPAADREAYGRWFETVRHFLRPGPDGRLMIDQEAKALEVRYDQADFFEKCLAAVRAAGKTADAARVVLERYAPEGPGKDAPPEAWEKWATENRSYLFFSEWGGYRWYIDPLAKARGVPTGELRGPARADKPSGTAAP